MKLSIGDWIAAFAMMGIWAGVIIAAVTFFHERRKRAQAARDAVIDARFAALATTIVDNRKAGAGEHEAMQRQVADIARSVSEHYMPRREIETAIRSLGRIVTGAQKEIGAALNALQGRVDELFTNVEWRSR